MFKRDLDMNGQKGVGKMIFYQVKHIIPPEDIEMFGVKGVWSPCNLSDYVDGLTERDEDIAYNRLRFDLSDDPKFNVDHIDLLIEDMMDDVGNTLATFAVDGVLQKSSETYICFEDTPTLRHELEMLCYWYSFDKRSWYEELEQEIQFMNSD